MQRLPFLHLKELTLLFVTWEMGSCTLWENTRPAQTLSAYRIWQDVYGNSPTTCICLEVTSILLWKAALTLNLPAAGGMCRAAQGNYITDNTYFGWTRALNGMPPWDSGALRTDDRWQMTDDIDRWSHLSNQHLAYRTHPLTTIIHHLSSVICHRPD